ncbi:MAG: hypothetical protein HXX20_24350 [Chloroflexi bacterium]|nr:hypothetical protein [Chloroflexota bacterium]
MSTTWATGFGGAFFTGAEVGVYGIRPMQIEGLLTKHPIVLSWAKIARVIKRVNIKKGSKIVRPRRVAFVRASFVTHLQRQHV